MNVSAFNCVNNKKLIFSKGSFSKLPEEAAFFGDQVLLLTGGKSLKAGGKLDELLSAFEAQNAEISVNSIIGEPSPAIIDGITAEFSNNIPDVICAVGGGSVIDSAKAVSAMLCQPGKISDYLEGVGTEKPTGRKVPVIAVPTTAGTGSEASCNAVITDLGPEGYKKSLRHYNYIPDVALIDPELYMSCPSTVAASSGMDALSQLVESYISTGSNFYTDMHVAGAIKLALEALPVITGSNESEEKKSKAWEKIAYASYISGFALLNAGLALVHGIAGPAGGFYDIPHGVICGTLLAPAMKHTINKLSRVEPESPYLLKFSALGNIASGSDDMLPSESRTRFIRVLEGLTESLNIPRFSDYGLKTEDLKKIAAASDNKKNPVKLDEQEIFEVLSERL